MERIFRVVNKGITNFETHISEGDRIDVEGDEVHIRSASQPVFTETTPVDVPSETQGATATERVMTSVAEEVVFVPMVSEPEESLSLKAEEVTVAELRQLLRDKDLPVSGTKPELLDRLNAAE